MKSKLLVLLALGVFFAASARAHFVWLERDAAGATAAYFGEWADNLRETQDGHLKLIAAPKAFAADGAALPVKIGHDRIAVAAPKTGGDIRLENTYRPTKGVSLVRHQARLGRTQTTARLDLELVPVEPDSNTFTLLLRGTPLADKDATLFTSSGWNRTFKTGADGRVTIETPWPGPAILEVSHVEPKPGEHEGLPHESIRHVFTLSFTVPAAS